MNWEIEFYQDNQGDIPVQEFILGQSAKVQAKLLHFIDLLQESGMSLGQPYIKKLRGSDVWELRIRHSQIITVFFISHSRGVNSFYFTLS